MHMQKFQKETKEVHKRGQYKNKSWTKTLPLEHVYIFFTNTFMFLVYVGLVKYVYGPVKVIGTVPEYSGPPTET
jgi:hypothetical protein